MGAEKYDRGIIKSIPGVGILDAWGDTVPADGVAGYATGCLFRHTDGGAGTAVYENVGSDTSCDFDAIDEGEITNIADDAVDADAIAASAVNEQHLANESSSGIAKGAIACKVIESAQLELLLDTNENDLFAVKEGDIILTVKLIIQAAAGATCAVTVGTDAAVDGTTKDVDSLLKAGDANATGIQSSDDVAATYLGADLAFGSFEVQGDGNITISASTDQHASSFVGKALMYYLPA